jgi:ribonuclease Z
MKMTFTNTSDTYAVHELLTPEDAILPCIPSADANSHSKDPHIMHICEVAGLDIQCSAEDGFWRSLAKSRGAYGYVLVDAGPISHRGQQE